MTYSNKKIQKLSEVIDPAFHDTWRSFSKSEYIRYVEKGGRASGKTSNISKMLVLTLMKEPINIVVFRKVADTLKRSVYEAIKWAINQLGVEEYFLVKKSPLEIIYLERGNQITFLGVDDPEKIKGLASSIYPYAVFWFEEITEFKTKEELETVIKSVVRGELPKSIKGEKLNTRYKGFFSYNPPRQRQHWVNKEYEIIKANSTNYINHTTYQDNPHLADEFYRDMEFIKVNDELMYRGVYLGEPVGNGIVPFPKLKVGKIDSKTLKTLDTFRCGIDWGYGPDPFCFVKWGYDMKHKRIYAISEVYGYQLDDDEAIKRVRKLVNKGDLILCDSSEPKTIARYKKAGFRAKPARKGAGSVEAGERWLGQLEIYIDPVRTPNIAREFQSIDYAVDRFGDVLPRLADRGNHTIDATRYAFEYDQKERRSYKSKNGLSISGI